ncbi:biotin synthase [Desulfitobacterium metallireducens DSM 15288]|uniref:Biotin synthase n=1 Tax=Desulfitobacterium metallireducens DSM 15288 TaxID=871968 RepID=W0E541_9FIRM|nr:biotin synthase [Desulfitobacterium metallireducens DSM 15288]
MKVKEILGEIADKHRAEFEELYYLLEHLNPQSAEILFFYAHKIQIRSYGREVYLRGLIEFSNVCNRNCSYCGIRRSNKEVERYRLTEEEILACCDEGYQLGYRTFVLQSGEDSYYDDSRLVSLIHGIKESYPEVAVTLSIGERSYESYKHLFQAGADRYLLRHETASETLYQQLHPGMSFQKRRQCLQYLKEIGYQIGAGFMVGLPGQENEDLVKDLIYLQELQPQMVGIGPFLPHPKTPLGGFLSGTVEKTLVLIALTRLLLPESLIPATTALGTLDPRGREKALRAGANVVMPNLSPTEIRGKYELYPNKICTGDEAAECRLCIEHRIEDSGFQVNMGRGDHLEWRR